MSWAFLADGALLEGQGSLTPVEVSFWVLLHALCPPTHAIVWALALASTGARVLGRHAATDFITRPGCRGFTATCRARGPGPMPPEWRLALASNNGCNANPLSVLANSVH